MLKRCLFFLVFTVSLVIGCGAAPKLEATYTNHPVYVGDPHRRIPIYLDKEFTAQDKLSIDDAVRSWNYALDGQIVLRVIDYSFDMEIDKLQTAQAQNAWLILKIDSNNFAIPEVKCDKKPGVSCNRTVAWCDHIGGNVIKVIRDRLKSEDITPVVMHEMGHALFVEHNMEEPNSLMSPVYTRAAYLCIDKYTITQVAIHYGLNTMDLNWCIAKY